MTIQLTFLWEGGGKGDSPIAMKSVRFVQLITQNMKLTGIKQRQRNVEIVDFRDWEGFVMGSYWGVRETTYAR